MAKFNYKMQNILNIKMRLETQAKTEFAEMSARLAEEERKMQQLIRRRKAYEQEAKKLAADKLNIPEMRHCEAAIRTVGELMRQQALQVRLAQKNLDRARTKLNETMQERKIQEKLKEKAFEAFKHELGAEEMKEIDQLVSFTYNDNSRETDE